jgi:hypothetical protein
MTARSYPLDVAAYVRERAGNLEVCPHAFVRDQRCILCGSWTRVGVRPWHLLRWVAVCAACADFVPRVCHDPGPRYARRHGARGRGDAA